MPRAEPRVNEIAVSPDYFRVLRVPLLAGRMLSSRDNKDAPLAIVVNQAFARQFFPGEDAVGHRVSLGIDAPVWLEIVGVVGDIRRGGLMRPPSPTFIVAFCNRSALCSGGRVCCCARPATPGAANFAHREKMTADVDTDEDLLFDVKTLEQRLDDSLGSRRFNAALIG